jgi:hypothetical protein
MTQTLIRRVTILVVSALLGPGLSAGAEGGAAYETPNKRERILADSIAADARADKTIDSLTRAVDALTGRIAAETSALSALKAQLPALTEAAELQEGARTAFAGRSRSAISKFNEGIASGKESLRNARAALDRARQDSAAASKKISQQEAGLRDSESVMEHSLAALHRQNDSLSAVQKKLERDSLSVWKANNDSLNAVCGRLNDLRRTNTAKDSAMRVATEDLNSSQSDSIAAVSSYAKESQARGLTAKTLDSLIPSLQGQKTAFLRMQEKLQLDSVIQDLSDQLRDFLRKSYDERNAASGPEAQKEQMLEAYKGKRDNLLRDETIIGMLAGAGDLNRQEWNRRVSTMLGVTQKRLDSAFEVQEKNVHDGVVNEKQFQVKIKELAVRNGTLNTLITKLSRELINAKPRLEKLEHDSASALKRRDSKSEEYRKMKAAVAAALAVSAAQSDSLTRLRDSMKTYIAGRENSFQKEREDAHAGVSRAADTARHAQAVLDSLAGLQQAARNDSIALDREKSVLVTQARQSIEMKQEEIKVKSDQIDLIVAQLAKAKNESITAVRDKRQQQDVYRQMLQEQQRLARQEELSVADLERKRAAALAAPAPAKSASRQTTAESAQDQLSRIYGLIDQGNSTAARKTYNAKKDFLKKNLFPEAFEAIKTTIEALEPEPLKAASTPSPTAKAKAAPAPAAVPAPVRPPPAPSVAPVPQPEPEPEQPRKEASVFISSVPPVASIFMDGQLVGKTNVGNVKVTSGKHIMQFLKGGLTCTMEMYFVEGVNPAQIVKLPCGQ